MIRSYIFQVIIRISFIIAVTATSTFVLYHNLHWTIVFFSLLVLTISTIRFISFLNKTNEQVNFFFESILNEDFNSVYALKRKSKILDQLNENLKKVNLKMQQALIANAKQEQYFKALIEHIGTGILTCNEDGFVIHANAGFKQLVGLEQLTHIKQLKKIDTSLIQAIKDIEHKEQRIINFEKNKQGSCKLLLKAVSFNTNEDNLKLISAQDINKELDENELDSWMKLIRVLTHEIMNSIAPITSLSETLSSLYSNNGDKIEVEKITEKMVDTTIRGLDVIQEQGKGLMHFVESYRSLMRLPKPKKEKICLSKFLDKIILINQNNFNNIPIKNTCVNKDVCISADKEQLTHVITNLIKNAVDALKETDDPTINISYCKNDKDQVEIQVKDNGPGIKQELLEEIFIPFFTTKETGSGIGLSLSRQIMRLHGGSLKVHSIPNKETVFKMLFKKQEY